MFFVSPRNPCDLAREIFLILPWGEIAVLAVLWHLTAAVRV